MMQCELCKYWLRLEGLDAGECHRNPPVAIGESMHVSTEWPQTSPENWCGEWSESNANPSTK